MALPLLAGRPDGPAACGGPAGKRRGPLSRGGRRSSRRGRRPRTRCSPKWRPPGSDARPPRSVERAAAGARSCYDPRGIGRRVRVGRLLDQGRLRPSFHRRLRPAEAGRDSPRSEAGSRIEGAPSRRWDRRCDRGDDGRPSPSGWRRAGRPDRRAGDRVPRDRRAWRRPCPDSTATNSGRSKHAWRPARDAPDAAATVRAERPGSCVITPRAIPRRSTGPRSDRWSAWYDRLADACADPTALGAIRAEARPESEEAKFFDIASTDTSGGRIYADVRRRCSARRSSIVRDGPGAVARLPDPTDGRPFELRTVVDGLRADVPVRCRQQAPAVPDGRKTLHRATLPEPVGSTGSAPHQSGFSLILAAPLGSVRAFARSSAQRTLRRPNGKRLFVGRFADVSIPADAPGRHRTADAYEDSTDPNGNVSREIGQRFSPWKRGYLVVLIGALSAPPVAAEPPPKVDRRLGRRPAGGAGRLRSRRARSRSPRPSSARGSSPATT